MTGKGHIITGDIGNPRYSEYGSFGLFGYVVSGIIKNLRMNAFMRGTSVEVDIDNVGSVVGFLENSTIQSCSITGYLESTGWCLGEIARKSYRLNNYTMWKRRNN